MYDAPLKIVAEYHERTKHHFRRYARSLGYMDWANQPDPFRRYEGAPALTLDHPLMSPEPTYDALFASRVIEPQPMDRHSLSRLFYDSLALSAWKQAPGTPPWSLRVNPSSGALHPTEGYLIAGPVAGLNAAPAVYHYTPYQHALEQRLSIPCALWQPVAEQLPPEAVLIALSSIYWREAWKYGERAFRYCHHDAGHAQAAVALAAAMLGWETRLVETVGDDQLAALLGLGEQQDPEAEHPDCLLAVYPRPSAAPAGPLFLQLPEALLRHAEAADFAGTPNRLSAEHHPWPVIDAVSNAVRRLSGADGTPAGWLDATVPSGRVDGPLSDAGELPDRRLPAPQIIRQRRSAVAMDGRTGLPRAVFYHIMSRLLPTARPPFALWPWSPRVSLALFVHRVEGLVPGLYVLVRHARHEPSLRAQLRRDFTWEKPPGCPDALSLWRLRAGDVREAARTISCHQDIAADGVFAVGMLAEFEAALRDHGPAFYPRLFWETGHIGQMLYLEAEAAGVRGTGIGCFFDDALHELLGIASRDWQSLYHFTVGGPLDDPRLQTLPAYAHLPERKGSG